MARKPINEVKSMQTRDAIWTAIRAYGKPFTAAELRKETACSDSQVREYLNCLTAAGILEITGQTGGNGFIKPAKLYELALDKGVEAPRVRRDGSEVTQGRGREQMWETMRALTSFTIADLYVFASTDDHPVAEREAADYCRHLAKAGYLRRDDEHYTLIKRTGPKPPMVQRVKSVYDPNLGKVVWSEGDAA